MCDYFSCLLLFSRFRFTRGITYIRYGRRWIKRRYPVRIRVGKKWRSAIRYRRRFFIRFGRKRRPLRFYRGLLRYRVRKRWRIIRRRRYRGRKARRRRRRKMRRRRRRRTRRRKRRRRRRARRRKRRRVRRRRRRRRRRIQKRRRRRCVLRFRFYRRWRKLVRRGNKLVFRVGRRVGYVR